MNLSERITNQFNLSIQTKQRTLTTLAPTIARAAEKIARCLKQGGKILSCGNGGSAADAQHFAAELLNRFEIERPGLAAIALTTDTSTLTSIANDYAFDQIFSKQIAALGRPGDLLLAITASGNSGNILQAMQTAAANGIATIALTGRDGGQVSRILNDQDTEIRVPSMSTARIQETHILIIHCFCDLVDHLLFHQGGELA